MPVADPGNGPGPTGREMGPCLEGWTALAALAALVPRVRVGLMVGGNTYRHPAVVAKMATTIDHISGGRAVIGLGAGWQVNEHQRLGIELGSPRERSDRLEEACVVIRELLSAERADFEGVHYQLVGAPSEPKPLQAHLPLLVGGPGERRTLETVALCADERNRWGRPEDMSQGVAVLREWCERVDRDPDEVRVTAAGVLRICADEAESENRRAVAEHRAGLVGTIDEFRTAVDAYRQAGVEELVIPDQTIPADRRAEEFGRFQTEVLSD